MKRRPLPSSAKQRFELLPHPDFPSPAVRSITVETWKESGSLELHYHISGAIEDLVWPARAEIGRADRLWEHTCFEAFVGVPGKPDYTELNFAPSGQWAAYGFDEYRAGMAIGVETIGSVICFDRPDGIALWCSAWLMALPYRREWQLNLSAIIEAKDGTKSYWALAHAPGPPDFHNRDCFTARLAAPTRP